MYQGALNFGILKAVFCIIIDSLGYVSCCFSFPFFLPFFFFFFLQNDVEAPAYLRTPGYASDFTGVIEIEQQERRWPSG